jgi:hypothetical protein
MYPPTPSKYAKVSEKCGLGLDLVAARSAGLVLCVVLELGVCQGRSVGLPAVQPPGMWSGML